MRSAFREHLLRVFPMPRFLEMPSVGLDISDASIKFIEFTRARGGRALGRFGAHAVPPGAVVSGDITRPDTLVEILKSLARTHRLRFVRASLPEERGYLFETRVPRGTDREMRSALEFTIEENVPISPSSAIFDYDIVDAPEGRDQKTVPVVVSVYPTADLESYLDLFRLADLTPLSLEIEAQAIARAVAARDEPDAMIVVDVGRARSGLSIVYRGVAHFTTTIRFGGDVFTEAARAAMPSASPEAIERYKNERGFVESGTADERTLARTLRDRVRPLRDEIDKYLVYWQTHHGDAAFARERRVGRVALCGGNANLAGLTEHLSASLKIPVARANVWTNAFSIEDTVPALTFSDSLGFAPAIGCALHS